MSYYTVEVSYKFTDSDKLSEDVMNKKSIKLNEDLVKLGKEFNGERTAYDFDYLFDSKNGSIQKSAYNNNWEFHNIDDIIGFVMKLPSEINILWSHKKNSDNSIEYSIYSSGPKKCIKLYQV